MEKTMETLIPNIMVDDMQNTVDFYKDLLEFDLIDSCPFEEEKLAWVMMKNNKVMIMFQNRKCFAHQFPDKSKNPVGGALTFYIEMKDVETFYNQIKDKVKIVSKLENRPYGKKEFQIEDCNGYFVSFGEDI